eukprot:scaffold4810_cov112-Isochrysis_galbana.AAC.1
MSLQNATGSTVHVPAPGAPSSPTVWRMISSSPAPAFASETESAIELRPTLAAASVAGSAARSIPRGNGGAASGKGCGIPLGGGASG